MLPYRSLQDACACDVSQNFFPSYGGRVPRSKNGRRMKKMRIPYEENDNQKFHAFGLIDTIVYDYCLVLLELFCDNIATLLDTGPLGRLKNRKQ